MKLTEAEVEERERLRQAEMKVHKYMLYLCVIYILMSRGS